MTLTTARSRSGMTEFIKKVKDLNKALEESINFVGKHGELDIISINISKVGDFHKYIARITAEEKPDEKDGWELRRY
jgi:hypothetical protein